VVNRKSPRSDFRLPTSNFGRNATRDVGYFASLNARLDPRDRLIFALDVPTKEEALAWIDRLGDAVTFYKLGLEFCMSGQYFEVLAELRRRGKKVFADLKFSDVPATVRGAVANLARHDATFCTLHGVSSVYRAVVPVKGTMQLLAITVLTSMDAGDVAELGWSASVEELVFCTSTQSGGGGHGWTDLFRQEAARLRCELGPLR
jgi:orotidine-5'-phosphate decarboxylase